jgi:hypothetical protein
MNYGAFFLNAISQLGLERNQGAMGTGNRRPWCSLPAMFEPDRDRHNCKTPARLSNPVGRKEPLLND